jgi:hypothetical protein
MVAQGFALKDIVRGYSLMYSFVAGFCIEEQAVGQAISAGDSRYSLEQRAERLSDGQTPLVLESGPSSSVTPMSGSPIWSPCSSTRSTACAGRWIGSGHDSHRCRCRPPQGQPDRRDTRPGR